MPGGKNYRLGLKSLSLLGTDPGQGISADPESGNAGIEKDGSPAGENSLAHLFYDSGQLVRSDMRMGFVENGFGCSMKNKKFQ